MLSYATHLSNINLVNLINGRNSAIAACEPARVLWAPAKVYGQNRAAFIGPDPVLFSVTTLSPRLIKSITCLKRKNIQLIL